MVKICFYFQVHQPHRLKKYSIFDIGKDNDYFDHKKNKEVMRKVARKNYLPMNNLLLHLIRKHNGKFKASFSITGTAMEQFEEYAPEVLESFKELAKTGHVEFLNETYHHSLSYLYSKEEFREQLELHRKMIKKHFKQEPKIFRNTELIFNNELAKHIEDLGYEGIIAEGADHILQGRTPGYVYKAVSTEKIKVLLKNYKLSDDIAFRFSNKGWEEHPLTAEKYASWIHSHNGSSEIINLFMDYETFGEHQWEDTGIFTFMKQLPEEILKHPDNEFVTVSEAVKKHEPRDVIDNHNFTSWADVERDLTAWLGNSLQNSAKQELYKIEKHVKATRNKELINTWRKMTTSDHFYYMCTKWFNDGDVHKYFNPYDSPYEAFITFMNVLNDFTRRINKEKNTDKQIIVHETPSMILTQ